MNDKNYTTSFTVDQTPGEAFAAIVDLRRWWSEEIEGDTDKVGVEFDYHYLDVHRCRLKTTELISNKKIVWHVLENYFKFTKDATEWTDTDLVFEISESGDKTEVRFTHVGLVPQYECYDICSNAWGTYINGSLKNLITTGKGEPNSSTQARTDAETEILNS